MSSTCPICDKSFLQEEIQSHVDKCLFLTSGNNTLKRNYVPDQTVTSPTISSKKPKNYQNLNNEKPSTSSKETNNTSEKNSKPLAELMRPPSLEYFIGQRHILGENSVLRNLLEQNNFPSMIFWGPPGCGKTSLANIIQRMCKDNSSYRYIKISATTAGVNDIKDIAQVARNDLQTFKRRTILFMDEIHRFNKLQQDIFLPSVESGVITLIGATTENPSFSLNNALLSRCRVFVLEKLSSSDIVTILKNTAESVNALIVQDAESSKDVPTKHKYCITEETINWLSEMCDGDARIAINSLQMALDSKENEGGNRILLTLEDIKEGIKKSHILYDRKGEEHYTLISALHKSIRASDDNAALYWLTRMIEGGEDPLFIARRLVRAASEDVGLSDPMALTVAVSAMQGCQLIGMPECDVLLAHAAVYLARTYKSQEVYRALLNAKDCIKNHRGPLPSVPLHLRNASTKLMSELGYGRGYNMRDKESSGLVYMPEGMESINFFPDIPPEQPES